ncbi:MAG TPA: type II toxin-antitoxin system RelE/ParE family toxin [Spirochaetota bacterium]|nr:type II toxin-antitoxin system RelE/ParE family toxin [Spirochaetota bacterium]HOS33209.1 type II toxin-antitoxin system RelE/ParE family toxin [Spirochaetota bacterium]HOS56276.1 type II toxin-antitoxin system RelE/ParE family toxin [Spirochaetota bacterium]HPK61690.1 type II toxin-antitoxin system RelE/ParE family toxin [Spirochaetota bacterium]HQF77490.1 type II toxin-antitoxin system RelE/ParE family toxin [Spirochaetota bacterium]
MILKYESSFNKDLKKIKDEKIKIEIIKLIEELKGVTSIHQIKNIKKMAGYDIYYRIKLNDYRIGLKFKDQTTLVLIRIKHRKDIYKIFP